MAYTKSFLRVILIVALALAGVGAVLAYAWGFGGGYQHFTAKNVHILAATGSGIALGLIVGVLGMPILRAPEGANSRQKKWHTIEMYLLPFLMPFLCGMVGMFNAALFH